MKKLFIAVVTIALAVITVSAKEQIIKVVELPISARSFVMKYFAGERISIATIDKDLLNEEYKILFDNSGTEIEFDSNGDWTSIETKKGFSVPQAIIPDEVNKQVKTKFPSNKVVKIERDKKNIEVELSNGVELKFNAKGKLVESDF